MKTIELTDLVINQIILDYDKNCVVVLYSMKDAQGRAWENSEATFWVTIPLEGTGGNWFQLPESYFPTLISLKNDADTTLTSTFLI